MARKGNEEEEQPQKKPNKKELKSARNKAKKAEAKPQYREKKVHVKASPRAKAHDETREVRVKDQSKFAAGATGGGQQKPPKGDTGVGAGDPTIGAREPQRNPPVGNTASSVTAGRSGPGLHERLVNAGVPDKELENPTPPTPPKRPPITGRDLGNMTATQLRRHAAADAAAAADYYQQTEGLTPRQAQSRASKEISLEYQNAYNTGTNRSQKNRDRGLAADELTPEEIKRTAFESFPKEPSRAEKTKSQAKTKSKVEKGVEKIKKDSGKQYKGSSTKGMSNKVSPVLSKEQQDLTKQKDENKKNLYPGKTVKKGKMSTREFIESRPKDEQAWIEEQSNTPGKLFYGMKGNKVPGAYRKWQRYMNARQEGYSDKASITKWLTTDTRGSYERTNTARPDKALTDKLIKARYTGGVRKAEGTKTRDRYKSAIPSHEDFGVGIRVPGIPSDREFKEMFPDKSDKEIFELKQSALQSIDEEFMKNTRMAHEQRQQNVLHDDRSETAAGDKDRVVFFTTSTGWPAISVGASSLVGQYIIKKRKKMLYDQRMAGRAELKGEYPWAVRDQHIMEVASGLSVGAQGRYGAFRHIGYRMGAKKSKGYGKTLPVGAQVLKDSTGQPIYDRNGNVRYTEGFTRPFDLRPSNEVGLRLYLG